MQYIFVPIASAALFLWRGALFLLTKLNASPHAKPLAHLPLVELAHLLVEDSGFPPPAAAQEVLVAENHGDVKVLGLGGDGGRNLRGVKRVAWDVEYSTLEKVAELVASMSRTEPWPVPVNIS